MKKFLHRALLLVLVYGAVELLSYWGLEVLERYRYIEYRPFDRLSPDHARIIKRFMKEASGYRSPSAKLGWVVRPYGSKESYRANAAGIRATRDYAPVPPSGVRRVTTFGDSYTHGSHVQNDETWQFFMESRGCNVEVLNFGVGGYGLDQAYLRYLEDGVRFQSHFVLIGFMPDDIYRTVNTFRPFRAPGTGLPLGKPRFVLSDEKLTLVPNPLQNLKDYQQLLDHPRQELARLGSHDQYYQTGYTSGPADWSPAVRLLKITRQIVFRRFFPENRIVIRGIYNPRSEAFQVTARIFDEFHRAVLAQGSEPVILVLPDQTDLILYRRTGRKRYGPLLSYFESVGYRTIDVTEAFQGTPVRDLFSGHYSPLANRLVGDYLLDRLGLKQVSPASTLRSDESPGRE